MPATLHVTVSEAAEAIARGEVEAGHWDSLDEVVEAALHALHQSRLPESDDEDAADELSEHALASIRRGLAQAERGEFVDPDDLLREIEARKASMR